MELRLEDLLGREVYAGDRRVGRIEEFRADKDGRIAIFVIGVAGLLERLGVGAGLLIGRVHRARVARWDQIDLTDPERPRLNCRLEDLERL